MTPPLDRRTLLKAGAAAGGLVAVGARPASAQAAPAQAATSVFRHGVASGDPLGTAVVLWTRVTPSRDAAPGSGRGASTTVVWELADDPAFRAVRRTGTVRTAATSDHTVKVDVTGLSPYTRYWYRFRALGVTSPVGRTQTAADDGRLHALRLAFVSCANWTGGYFTGYRYVARRDDLDLVLHLGDYLYEYGNAEDRYGPATLVGEREHDPATEMVSLSDYRRRHAQYKTDPDLQAAHAAHPWIVVLDDHEVANDTYDTGAENHTEGAEGAFGTRRTRAYQAYVEWMPIRLPDQTGAVGVRFWRRFSFGPLADLSVIDTRQNRSIPLDGVQGALVGTDLAGLTDPSRVLMEPAQMAWLTDGLRDDAVRWHLIGNQTVFTRVALGRSTPQALAPLGLGSAAFNTDQWDGYQDDQRQVLQAMAAAGGDPVVLTGDIHSSWANDCPLDPSAYVPVGPLNDSVGVEFVCPSITSDGFTEILGGDEAALAATTGLQVTNPHVRYLDGIGHGFAVLDVTPERVQSDFWFVSSREDQDATLRYASGWQSTRGSRQVVAARGPVGARSDRPRTAVVTAPPPARSVAAPAAAPAAGGRTLPTTGGPMAVAAAAAALLVAGTAARRVPSATPADGGAAG